MKKVSMIFSIITGVIFCWTVLFKLMHWPGGNVMTFGACIFAVISTILGSIVYFKSGILSKCAIIFNAVVLVLTFAGIWFKTAHWPGGSILCMLCLGILVPVAIIWTAISYSKLNK
jgi:hypothetical protein